MQVKSISTFIKLPFVIKIFVLSILSCRFTQVLLYKHANKSIPHQVGNDRDRIDLYQNRIFR